jgi:hypothetical protein
LFFLFRSDCPYCQQFAPLLQRFEQKFGLPVFAISLDGGTLPEFPRARVDNGIAATLNVAQVPALFLASPRTNVITPLGYGVLPEPSCWNGCRRSPRPAGNAAAATPSPRSLSREFADASSSSCLVRPRRLRPGRADRRSRHADLNSEAADVQRPGRHRQQSPPAPSAGRP